jgi:hypothetical protein
MKKKIIISIALILSLVAIISAVVISHPGTSSEETTVSASQTTAKNKTNLAYKAIDSAANTVEKTPSGILTGIVTSKIVPVNIKSFILDKCSSDFILLDYDRLKNILTDTDANNILRYNILCYLSSVYGSNEGFSDVLYSLCSDDDEDLSFSALRSLYFHDRSKALSFIKTVIYERPDDFSHDKVGTALGYMARDIRDHSSDYATGDEKNRFIEYCKNSVDNGTNAASALSLLATLNTPKTTVFVLTNSKTDDCIKETVMQDSYYSLRDYVFDGGVTLEKTEFYLDCFAYGKPEAAVTDLESILADAPALFGDKADEIAVRLTETLDAVKEANNID